MSKSKYNGVDPLTCIATHGADATRAHILFAAPVADVLNWDEDKIIGVRRFLLRVLKRADICTFVESPPSLPEISTPQERKLWKCLNDAVRSVTEAFSESLAMNTTISDLMKLENAIESERKDCSVAVVYAATQIMLRLLAPITPAVAEEAWEMLHRGTRLEGSKVLQQPWPQVDTRVFEEADVKDVAIAFNGKVRLTVQVEGEVEGGIVRELLRGRKEWEKWASGKEIVRVVVAKGGKLVNFVVR